MPDEKDKDKEIRDALAGIETGIKETRGSVEATAKEVKTLGERVGKIEEKHKVRTVSLPGVEDEKEQFSLQRAIRAIASRDWSDAGFERAVFCETAKLSDPRGKRDLSAGVDSAGGYIVPQQLLGEFIDLLRAKTVVYELGATRLPGLVGSPVKIAKQTSGATAYMVAENADITESQLAVGMLDMKPHEMAAMSVLSNRLLNLSNPSAEAMIRQDFARVLARKVDQQVLRGTDGVELLGIVNTAGINTTTTDAVPTLDDLYDMILEVEQDNADDGALGWAMHPRTWNTLRKIKDSEGQYVLSPAQAPNSNAANVKRGAMSGTLLGYPFRTTTQIPITLDSPNAESELYFGNWADVVVGEWGGMEILASKETSDAFQKNQTWVRIIMELDSVLRHPESFVVDSTIRA